MENKFVKKPTPKGDMTTKIVFIGLLVALLFVIAGTAIFFAVSGNAHPDHEKLIQIAGENGDKFQPFQGGNGLIRPLLQDPAVEAEPAELPVLGIGIIGYDALRIFWHR